MTATEIHLRVSNVDEQQLLLWVRSYPGITMKMLRHKRLSSDWYIKQALSSLVRKGFIEEIDSRYYCVKEWVDV